MANNREYQRKNASITATFTRGGASFSGDALDLSLGGAFIRVETDIEVGEIIELTFHYLSVGNPFVVEGTVVSRREEGIGVKFGELTPEQKDLIGFLFW